MKYLNVVIVVCENQSQVKKYLEARDNTHKIYYSNNIAVNSYESLFLITKNCDLKKYAGLFASEIRFYKCVPDNLFMQRLSSIFRWRVE